MPHVESVDPDDIDSPSVTDNTDESVPASEEILGQESVDEAEGGASSTDFDEALSYIFGDDDDEPATSLQDTFVEATARTQELLTQAETMAAPLAEEELSYMDQVRLDLSERAMNPKAPTTPPAAPAAEPATETTETTVALPDDAPDWAKDLAAQNAALVEKTSAMERKEAALLDEKRAERATRQRAQFDAAVSDPNGQFYVAADMREIAYKQLLTQREELKQSNQHNTRLGDLLDSVHTKMPSLVAKNEVDPNFTDKALKAAKSSRKRLVTPKAPPKGRPKGGDEPSVLNKPAAAPTKKIESMRDASDAFREAAYKRFGL